MKSFRTIESSSFNIILYQKSRLEPLRLVNAFPLFVPNSQQT